MLESVLAAIKALEMALEEIRTVYGSFSLPNGSTPSEDVSTAVGMIALAPNIISAGARLALRESVHLSPSNREDGNV